MYRSIALLVVIAAPAAAQNLVVNGDFERTKATGCEFNLPNPVFDALMPGCTGFGTWQGVGQIDIMRGGTCGFGLPAASGLVKLGIGSSKESDNDAFSFRLKTPLVPGKAYRLRFKANAFVSSFSPQLAPVVVGLSSSPTQFGVQVGVFLPSAVVWSSFDAIIVPATSARFLTVRYPDSADGWNHVDDFSLETADEAGPSVTADGQTLHVTGATPGSPVAILISPAGSTGSPTLATLTIADEAGVATIARGHVAGSALWLQAVDLSTGAVSPVATFGGFSSAETQQEPPGPAEREPQQVEGGRSTGASEPSPP